MEISSDERSEYSGALFQLGRQTMPSAAESPVYTSVVCFSASPGSLIKRRHLSLQDIKAVMQKMTSSIDTRIEWKSVSRKKKCVTNTLIFMLEYGGHVGKRKEMALLQMEIGGFYESMHESGSVSVLSVSSELEIKSSCAVPSGLKRSWHCWEVLNSVWGAGKQVRRDQVREFGWKWDWLQLFPQAAGAGKGKLSQERVLQILQIKMKEGGAACLCTHRLLVGWVGP